MRIIFMKSVVAAMLGGDGKLQPAVDDQLLELPVSIYGGG